VTGTQQIHLSIKQPSINDLASFKSNDQTLKYANTLPKLEIDAQFNSIKCFLCPKQVHLLYELFNSFTTSVTTQSGHEATTSQQLLDSFHEEFALSTNTATQAIKQKPIRGCDQQKFESLLQNDLLTICGANNIGIGSIDLNI
jgi:hypothetical protein